jgi:hypothetical protein
MTPYGRRQTPFTKRMVEDMQVRNLYIEGPSTEKSSPEHVLKYLASYLTGGPDLG